MVSRADSTVISEAFAVGSTGVCGVVSTVVAGGFRVGSTEVSKLALR